MPFVSEAQRRKMAELVKQGKLPKSVFDEFEKDTPTQKLPERAGPRIPKVRFVKKAPVIK